MSVWSIIGILLILLGNFGSFSDLQAKLEALEAAHKAGILTEAEYASKKTELEAQIREATLDDATKQKLQALEAAHQAGILSDQEYERKKAEILGQKPAGLTQYKDPQERFQFQYSKDWAKHELQDGRVALTRGDASLIILTLPDGADAQQYLESISKQISKQWQNYKEVRRGEQEVSGQPAPMVEFTGVAPQGKQAHAQVVVLTTGIKGYAFILTALEADPENGFGVIQPVWQTLLGSFTLTGEKGKSYHHAAGFSFWYPEDWKLMEQEGTIQLTPPNSDSTAEGPLELYFVTAEDLAESGIQNPDDPALIEYLDEQIKSLSPALQRTGSISPIDTRAGKGVIVDWGATGTGGDVRARAFVGIINNNGAILVAMGLKERVEARDPDLRRIFASFRTGEPQSNLADDLMQHFSGTWVNYTKNTETRLTLSPNGEYYYGYESSYSGQSSDQYGDVTGTWGTAGQSHDKGRWTVRGDKRQGSIVLTSQDGTESVLQYKVHEENGQIYWNEYWINEDLYGKQQ